MSAADDIKPLLTGEHEVFTLHSVLINLARNRIGGTLIISPSGAKLHLRAGMLEAVEGAEPLGMLLVQREIMSEETLIAALKHGVPLGQWVLKAKLLTEQGLRDMLRLQARMGLSYLLKYPGQSYALYPEEPLPQPTANLPLTQAMIEAVGQEVNLPTEQPLRLAAAHESISLNRAEWNLARYLNGRRTLASAMRLSGLDTDVAERAARSLLNRSLLEPASVQGLRLIVPRRAKIGSNYHPPSSISANLFLKAVDGLRNAWQVGQSLQYEPEESATLLADLHREGLVEVVRGHKEFERLLEEF